MNKKKKDPKKSSLKRTLLEWGGIAAVVGVLYLTGLHTEVIGTLQRALLWTGLFNADTPTVETVDGPMLTQAAFNLPLESSRGEQLHLEKYKGKVLFVNVWASWCPPCVAEMPTIETLYENTSDNENIKFLLISLDEEKGNAVEFMEDKDFPMPYYFPVSGMPEVFRSPYIPSTYVISKEGQVIFKREGIADYSTRSFRQWLTKQAEG